MPEMDPNISLADAEALFSDDRRRAAGKNLLSPFNLWTKNKDCFLLVAHPANRRETARVQNVLRLVSAWPLKELDQAALERALNSPQVTIQFGTLHAPTWIDPDAPFFFSIPDTVRAYVAPTSRGWGKSVDVKTLLPALKAEGISAGIDKDALTALATSELTEPRLIAQGKAGRETRHVSILWAAFPELGRTGTAGRIVSVNAGQLLAEKTPGLPGTPTDTI
ncbi:MAG: flagellar assembly protein A, partial [Chloroflexota bacterium]